MQEIPHIPVLLNEVKDVFNDIKDGYIVDCTVGYGGHSEALLRENKDVKLICIDQDEEALNFSQNRLKEFKDRVVFKQGRFAKTILELEKYNIKGILADIGVSSLQLDKKDRGFAFDSEVLDMRMDKNIDLNAIDVINRYSKEALENLLKEFGEIRDYKKITKMIINARNSKEIRSAKEFIYILSPQVKSNKNLALIFQAIRIEVNNELGEIANLLKNIAKLNFSQCKVAIISFHSLEDRIVKRNFKDWTNKCICPMENMRCECGNNNDLGVILTKKPITPTDIEIKQNPRSRSSKMRVFKFY